MHAAVLGWDIGGANTKAALVQGHSVRVAGRACPLWEGPERLRGALLDIAAEMGAPELMGLTLTAELADSFATKRDGVTFVVDLVESSFPGARLSVMSSGGRFCTPAEARSNPLAVASANWAATAHLLAREGSSMLLVDVGTTTTDIVPVIDGEVAVIGTTDPERLRSGELLYTGVVRTPVCAMARVVPLRQGHYRLAAEFFAQSGDIYLWLGRLGPADYPGRTPDGRGKTRAEAGDRLARMICADRTIISEQDLTLMAEHLADRQVRTVAAALARVRARWPERSALPVVVAGLGSFLAKAAARRLGLESEDLAARMGEAASQVAPAVAVARLLQAGAP